MKRPHRIRLGLLETVGLEPFAERMREAKLAVMGDGETKPSRMDLTSLGVLAPKLGLGTWLGRTRRDRKIPIYNLWNHTQTPPEEGWSVRRTQLHDFRGQKLTYDSHNGTDFVVPPGTLLAAPAPAVVRRVSSEWNRGGLKVFLDHGRGLVTTHNHLGRVLVREGDVLRRGDPFAVSAYSGLDALLAFPFSTPHVHMNVWLGGRSVDPFAREDSNDASLFRVHNAPVPWDGLPVPEDAAFEPTSFDAEGVRAGIALCRHDRTRELLEAEARPEERAMSLLFFANYYPTRFRGAPEVYPRGRVFAREPVLDLPFFASDFDGIVLEPSLGESTS